MSLSSITFISLVYTWPFFFFFELQLKVRLLYKCLVSTDLLYLEHFIPSGQFSSYFPDVVHAEPHK